MTTVMRKMKHGKWKVAIDGLVVGVVERSSRSVRHPSGKMVRVGTWVALRHTGTKTRRRVGAHVATRREAVRILERVSVAAGVTP